MEKDRKDRLLNVQENKGKIQGNAGDCLDPISGLIFMFIVMIFSVELFGLGGCKVMNLNLINIVEGNILFFCLLL